MWGSGDISIDSFPGPGEEDGRGGVVTHSVLYQQWPCQSSMITIPRPLGVPKRFEENKDRRGVGNWGLALVSISVYNCSIAGNVPLVDVEVLGQVGSKARCWR